jgi:putative hydrolase of the HAD superfamily
VLVAVGGGVASGKTTVARQLAPMLDALHVSADDVRAEMPETGLAAFSLRAEDHIYAQLLRRAHEALATGQSVVLDGCYALLRERQDARALAIRRGASFLFLECRASESILYERLAARDAELSAGEIFWREIHDEVERRLEPVTELPADEYEIVRTDQPTDARLAQIAARARMPRERFALPAAVTFDCWNTLMYEDDWHLAHALRVARLQEMAGEAGRAVAREEAERAFDAAWNRHMDLWRVGEVSGAREVALWGLAELGLAEPHPALEHLVAAFEEASHTSDVRALDGARETLELLAAAGIPCALVCDTGLTPGRVVRRHLDRLGLLDGLAVQIFSDEVGVPKPDPKAFRAALEPLGVRPKDALHVGDLRRTDVAGARGLGMRSVRILDRHDDTTPLPEADFVVSSHAGLRALFNR